MPSGLQLAHFISATAAKKSTAPACGDKQSVLILVPQYVIEESQMSPNDRSPLRDTVLALLGQKDGECVANP